MWLAEPGSESEGGTLMFGRFLTLGVGFIVAGCATAGPPPPREGPAETPAGRPAQERTLVMAAGTEPHTLAAFGPASSGLTGARSIRFFNAFLELVDDRGVARPYLAEAVPTLNTETWQVFPDGRMETRYRLRPNLTWHDGTAFTAEDIGFAWRSYTTPELGFAAAAATPLNLMEEVLTPDARTVVIRWRRLYPSGDVLQVGGVTNLGLPPLPRHILEGLFLAGQWDSIVHHRYWNTEFVGLGPYRLDRWELGTSLEGTAFDAHVLGAPKIHRIRIMFIGDQSTALANLRAGVIEFFADSGLSFELGLEIKREWEQTKAGSIVWTAASIRHMPFQFRPEIANPRAILDARVRKALVHALDRKALNDGMWGGENVVVDTFFSPRAPHYPLIDRAIAKYPYDLRSTERLMNEAGFTKGADGIYASPAEGRMAIEVKSRGQPVSERQRTIVASGWRQAGFDAQEVVIPRALDADPELRAVFATVSDDSQSATEVTMAAAFSSAQISRPENRWNGINRGGWSNAEYDRLERAFNTTLDRNERVEQRIGLARIVSEEVPTIFLLYNLTPYPFVASLQGPVDTTPDTTGYTNWNAHEWELR